MTTPFCQGADWKPRRSITVPGPCGACGKPLTGRTRWFCPTPYREQYGESCRSRYMRNHGWSEARAAAIRRDDGKCRRCGKQVLFEAIGHDIAEVNHIEPRKGRGYSIGCWNHQDNLETLCHNCHLVTTAAQRGHTPEGRVATRQRERHERDLRKLASWTGIGT